MTLQRVSQNCLRSSAAHSGCIPPTKYAFLFMPGAPSSLPSGLFGCCSGADSFNSNFFRLRFEVSTHSLFSTDCIPSFLFSSDVSGSVFLRIFGRTLRLRFVLAVGEGPDFVCSLLGVHDSLRQFFDHVAAFWVAGGRRVYPRCGSV